MGAGAGATLIKNVVKGAYVCCRDVRRIRTIDDKLPVIVSPSIVPENVHAPTLGEAWAGSRLLA
jgi:hypothetical protein